MPRNKRQPADQVIVVAARRLRCDITPAEEMLWQVLRNRGLSGLKFRRQHPLGNYVLDFFCAEQKLAIEVDGDVHLDPEQQYLDAERTAWLNQLNITILRFTNAEVEEALDQVLSKIRPCIDTLNNPPLAE